MNKIKITVQYMMLLFSILWLSACQVELGGSNDLHDKPFKALKLFPQGKAFSGFELISHENQQWRSEQFKGNYSILFFGFSNCPDICPTTMLDMQKIDKRLGEQNLDSPRFVFISVDPNRDTPEVLKNYVSFFNPEFYALTGDAANILSIASQLGVAYKVADHEPGDLIYDVDHASALFVLDPKGERIGIFTAPHDVDAIAHDVALMMES